MTTDGGSAGTAAANFRATPAEHPWAPTAPEHGQKPRCRHNCGRGKDEHPRKGQGNG